MHTCSFLALVKGFAVVQGNFCVEHNSTKTFIKYSFGKKGSIYFTE